MTATRLWSSVRMPNSLKSVRFSIITNAKAVEIALNRLLIKLANGYIEYSTKSPTVLFIKRSPFFEEE